MKDKTYDQCLTDIASVFNEIDINKDGLIDQCEDAKFLLGIGNSEEYATTYAGTGKLSEVQQYCMYIVPDAFDQVKTKSSSDMMTDMMHMWPFSMLMPHEHDDDVDASGSG